MSTKGGHPVWRDLRNRPDIECMVTSLPAGVRPICAVADDGHRAILIDRNLSPVERLAPWAHELAHLDRGGGLHHPGLPDRLRPLVTRDEVRVYRAVAARLIPADALRAWLRARSEVGAP